MNKLGTDHKAQLVKLKDTDGSPIDTVLSKVVDVGDFVETIATVRKIKKPQFILGCDGGQNKLVVTAIVKEENDDDSEEVVRKDFKVTGSKRVLCLAKIDGVPGTRENVEVLMKAVDLTNT